MAVKAVDLFGHCFPPPPAPLSPWPISLKKPQKVDISSKGNRRGDGSKNSFGNIEKPCLSIALF